MLFKWRRCIISMCFKVFVYLSAIRLIIRLRFLLIFILKTCSLSRHSPSPPLSVSFFKRTLYLIHSTNRGIVLSVTTCSHRIQAKTVCVCVLWLCSPPTYITGCPLRINFSLNLNFKIVHANCVIWFCGSNTGLSVLQHLNSSESIKFQVYLFFS